MPGVINQSRFGERLDQLTDRRRIAVLPVRGVIGGALRTDELLRTLTRVRRNPHIRALLLEIDSPGGGATASEALHLALKRVAAEKPVVAWIRGTGASGAYFLACGATRILSFPSAIVGSIGVISVRPIAAEALRRLGTSIFVTKTGPFKDLGAPWREPSDDDVAKERDLVDTVFRRFVAAVRGARGFDDAAVRRVTTGEVWLGTHALDLGLVDALAEDEEVALEVAQDLAALPHRYTLRLGPRRTLMQRLGMPGAGMGPPGERWITELEGWLQVPRLRS
jgi:protease-4